VTPGDSDSDSPSLTSTEVANTQVQAETRHTEKAYKPHAKHNHAKRVPKWMRRPWITADDMEKTETQYKKVHGEKVRNKRKDHIQTENQEFEFPVVEQATATIPDDENEQANSGDSNEDTNEDEGTEMEGANVHIEEQRHSEYENAEPAFTCPSDAFVSPSGYSLAF